MEHILYDVMIDNANISSWYDTYFGEYKNKLYWTSLFEQYDFRRIPFNRILKNKNTINMCANKKLAQEKFLKNCD